MDGSEAIIDAMARAMWAKQPASTWEAALLDFALFKEMARAALAVIPADPAHGGVAAPESRA